MGRARCQSGNYLIVRSSRGGSAFLLLCGQGHSSRYPVSPGFPCLLLILVLLAIVLIRLLGLGPSFGG